MKSKITDKHKKKPLYVHLLLTMECNLRCPHCFVEAGKKLDGEMDTIDMMRIAKELVEMRVHTVHVEGGEALLFRDGIDVLKQLSKIHELLLVTNGKLITKETARNLSRAGVKHVAISIDGATKETHEKFRPNTYNKAVSAIKILKDEDIKVRVSTTLMKPNVSECALLVDKCIEWGVEHLNYDAFDLIGRGALHPEYQLSGSDWDFVVNYLFPKALSVADNMRIKVSIPTIYADKIDFTDSHIETVSCTAGESQLEILPDGSVVPCYIMAARPEFRSDNLKEQSLKDIWANSPYLKYYRTLVDNKQKCPIGYDGHIFFSNTRK